MQVVFSKIAFGLLLLFFINGNTFSVEPKKAWEAYNSGDFVTALHIFRKLAAQGDSSAQYNLGMMYAFGQGVTQDNVYAHMWWTLAATSGDADAASYRDFLAKDMSLEEVSRARGLAQECLKKKYLGCE
ncbi:MAG: hypothetical protein CMF71_00980 [Magnetovibrio sp.]|nr:hypothetical protein [Magnetovibrio sp.]|tara:strand:+ start:264 stop:650 length:387 start_codon:yes stop_codon:yes gene_type:complete